MLEAINLCKVYKPKKGVPVKALDGISLRFPEKGMVFLLGKSGSGKSTLLNLLGGLDKYDSGEIIIKGVSSKDFKQQYFDSYRNTYVGFIFQEYNILDEFSVGANIALAIELQGRKATDEEINNILREVDLEGYGDRKPNELSGGQKQRVAIARALIKNPEIIMADEPTGALDSNTGRQIFDTLKKLSRDKLVIIVSHDREFSEQYADRIIELADGHVISDVEYSGDGEEAEQEDNVIYDNDMVRIASGYHLTEEDRLAINDYIDRLGSGQVTLRLGKNRINSKRFTATDQNKIKKQDGSAFKLIKSKLPLKNAFKIGASGLKYKKIRLIITILLSCQAFGLFGLADTFGSYNHIKVCTNSLIDSGVKYLAYSKSVKSTDGGNGYWWNSGNYKISKEEVQQMERDLNIPFSGVFSPIRSIDLGSYYNPEAKFTETEFNIYARSFSGFTEIDNDKMDKLNVKLAAGRLPDGNKNELAVSEYVFESFKIGGYRQDNSQKAGKIEKYDDLIGKTLKLEDEEYTITGIVDTGLNLDRYESLTKKKEGQSTADALINYALYNEFSYETGYGLAGTAMVGDGHLDKMIQNEPKLIPINAIIGLDATNDGYNLWSNESIVHFEDVPKEDIVWTDGEKKELGDKEIIVTFSSLNINSIENTDITSVADNLKDIKLKLWINGYDGSYEEYDGYKIVGIVKDDSIYAKTSSFIVSDTNRVNELTDSKQIGEYNYVVGVMPQTKADVMKVVSYSYRENSDIRYEIQNSTTYELDTVNTILKKLAKVFMYIGIGFAVFATVMLANFIATSVAHKKQEIGILRAIGSRSNDVFRIFFSESFIIAMINFVLSAAGVFAVTMIINNYIRKDLGVLISILTFGPRQVLLILVLSIFVAAAASFIPVKKIASKKPVDAIRNR